MKKIKSAKYLYEVRLLGGSRHAEWTTFYEGVSSLSGKSPDYGGIRSVAVIGSHHDIATVHSMITSGMKAADDVEILEITGESLSEGKHRVYRGLIDRAFLPYGDYPNVGD